MKTARKLAAQAAAGLPPGLARARRAGGQHGAGRGRSSAGTRPIAARSTCGSPPTAPGLYRGSPIGARGAGAALCLDPAARARRPSRSRDPGGEGRHHGRGCALPRRRARVDGEEKERALTFRTNVGDIVAAGPEHPLRFAIEPETGGLKPYVHGARRTRGAGHARAHAGAGRASPTRRTARPASGRAARSSRFPGAAALAEPRLYSAEDFRRRVAERLAPETRRGGRRPRLQSRDRRRASCRSSGGRPPCSCRSSIASRRRRCSSPSASAGCARMPGRSPFPAGASTRRMPARRRRRCARPGGDRA